MNDVDRRLLDAVAAALCWAEFGSAGHAHRTDDPATYWAHVGEQSKVKYRESALPLAMFMRGSNRLAIVPEELTPAMLSALRCCVRASEPNLRQAWSLALREAWLSLGKIIRGAEQ